MSALDGDYAGIEPTDEELLSINTEDILPDPDREVLFDPEEYEIESNGVEDFNTYHSDEDDEDDEDDY